jgi:hypothetical protein
VDPAFGRNERKLVSGGCEVNFGREKLPKGMEVV